MTRQKWYAVAGGATVLTLGIWIATAGPMLVNVKGGLLQRRLALFNPVRDRSPERYAAMALAQIQSSDCERAAIHLGLGPEQQADACSKQTRLPVTNCRLIERQDAAESSWILYYCDYVQHPGARAEIDVDLFRSGAQWKIRSYERIYIEETTADHDVSLQRQGKRRA